MTSRLASPFDALVEPIAEVEPLVALIGEGAAAGNLLLQSVALRATEANALGLADCFRALRELSKAKGQETFNLSARPMMAGTAELVFSKAAGCATVGEAMREIANAYNVLHGGAYNRVEQRGRLVVYVMDDERFPYTRPRDAFLHFSLECAMIFLHSALSELADRDLGAVVRQVTTRRPKSEASPAPLAFWDAPVRHAGQVYSVAYDAAVAALPLSRRTRAMAPDLAVHNRILSLIEAREAVGRRETTEAQVRRAIADGLHGQDKIAERLGVSTATLRRRLAMEGASFRELYQALLNDRARRWLEETRDVGGVAERLGFSDTRSFTRAFKGWTGLTPSAFLIGRSQPAR
jgi:AraC-like DNA-binding protein